MSLLLSLGVHYDEDQSRAPPRRRPLNGTFLSIA
jgi:hypothetical protein